MFLENLDCFRIFQATGTFAVSVSDLNVLVKAMSDKTGSVNGHRYFCRV